MTRTSCASFMYSGNGIAHVWTHLHCTLYYKYIGKSWDTPLQTESTTSLRTARVPVHGHTPSSKAFNTIRGWGGTYSGRLDGHKPLVTTENLRRRQVFSNRGRVHDLGCLFMSFFLLCLAYGFGLTGPWSGLYWDHERRYLPTYGWNGVTI